VGDGGGSQDTLLRRAHEVPVGPQLTDDARPDAGIADAVFDVMG